MNSLAESVAHFLRSKQGMIFSLITTLLLVAANLVSLFVITVLLFSLIDGGSWR